MADDPKGSNALEQWLEQKEDLIAGREPRAKSDGLTIADLCNHFLAHKEQLRDNGELSPRPFRGHYDTCATIVQEFKAGRAVTDLVPDDFCKLRDKLWKSTCKRAARRRGNRQLSPFISKM